MVRLSWIIQVNPQKPLQVFLSERGRGRCEQNRKDNVKIEAFIGVMWT